jgi:hypothetical protein
MDTRPPEERTPEILRQEADDKPSDNRPVCWPEESISRYQEQVSKMRAEQKGRGA